MGYFVFLLGFLGLISSIVFLIINLIKKKPKKSALISTVVCFIVSVMGLFLVPAPETPKETVKKEVEKKEITKVDGKSVVKKESEEKVKEIPKEKAKKDLEVNKNDSKKKSVTKADKQKSVKVKNEITLDKKIETIVSKKADKSDKKSIKVDITDDLVVGNGAKIVRIEAYSTAPSKLSFLDDSSYVFKEVFKQIDEVSEVNLTWTGQFTDIKGNKNINPVMRVLLRKDNAKDINWDNFDINNLEKIADQYWQSKGLE